MITEIDLRYPDKKETKFRFDEDYYVHVSNGKVDLCCDCEPFRFTLDKKSIELLESALEKAKELI